MDLTRRVLRLIILAGAVLVMSASIAQAQYFTYSTIFTPNPVPATPAVAGSRLDAVDGATNTVVYAGGVGSNVVLTNLIATSDAPDGTPARIDSDYDILISLAPVTSANQPVPGTAAQTWHVVGHISGAVSVHMSSLTNTFRASSFVYDFGHAGTYVLSDLTFVAPGAPGTTARGAIGAHVTWTPDLAPEGSSLAMLLTGGAPVLIALHVRRRVRKP